MPNHRPLPPLERLNELLEVVEIPEDKYGKWSGLVWKVNRGPQRAGSVAGTPKPDPGNPGRVNWKVGVDGFQYIASRLIYFIVYGEDPGGAEVDHEDQNWLNNNAGNLRLDTNRSFQQVNRPAQRNNVSGVMGVHWSKVVGKWRVEVNMKSLGYFSCKAEAARVANEKWSELGWDKLGRKLHDLEAIECDCESCMNRRPA